MTGNWLLCPCYTGKLRPECRGCQDENLGVGVPEPPSTFRGQQVLERMQRLWNGEEDRADTRMWSFKLYRLQESGNN